MDGRGLADDLKALWQTLMPLIIFAGYTVGLGGMTAALVFGVQGIFELSAIVFLCASTYYNRREIEKLTEE